MAGITYTSPSSSSSLSDLGGGLNSTASALSLNTNEMSDLQNVDFDVFGSIKKRNGYAQLNTVAVNSGAACTGLHYYVNSVSSIQKLIGTFEDKLYKMDDLDGTFDEITISGASLSTGQDNLVDFTTFSDTLILTNGIDVPIKWTGTGNASPAGVPTNLTDAKFVTNWNNYVFYAHVQVDSTWERSRFYWSNIKDPDTWTSTDFIDVAKNDGDEITGIEPLGDRLVIFKEDSIHNVFFTGDADIPFIVTKSKSDTGAISGFSIQRMENGLKFLSDDGYYFYDGNNSTKVSDKVTTTLNSYAKNRFNLSVSTHQKTKNTYWSTQTTSGSSSSNRIVVWNSVKNAYSVYNGLNANALITFKVNGGERTYFGDYAGFVYRADFGDNDNPEGTETAINAYFKTKWFSFGDITNKKATPHIVFYFQISDSTLALSYAYDLEESAQFSQNIFIGTSGDVYDAATYDTATYASSGGGVKRRDIKARGRLVRFEFSNATLDETFQIDGIGFYPHLETVK